MYTTPALLNLLKRSLVCSWQQQAAKLESGEITKDNYGRWRYSYPQSDTGKHWAKVLSQELSDYLVKELKNNSDKKK